MRGINWVRLVATGILVLAAFGAAGQALGGGLKVLLWTVAPTSLIYGLIYGVRHRPAQPWPKDLTPADREAVQRTVNGGQAPADLRLRQEAARRLRLRLISPANQGLTVGVFAAIGAVAAGLALIASPWWWLTSAAFIVLALLLAVGIRRRSSRLRRLELTI